MSVPLRIRRENEKIFAGDPQQLARVNNWVRESVDWEDLIGSCSDDVSYIGVYRTANHDGSRERYVCFVIRSTENSDGNFIGTIDDEFGSALVEGTIKPNSVCFIKKYKSPEINPKAIIYGGESTEEGVYIGEWSFEASENPDTATHGKFKMRTLKSAGSLSLDSLRAKDECDLTKN